MSLSGSREATLFMTAVLVPNKLTWPNICLNSASIVVQSAEMTGSLCRHTAAIKVHGESSLPVTAWVRELARQRVVFKNRHCLCLAGVFVKVDRNVKKDRLAILPQGAAIFSYCLQCTSERKRNSACNWLSEEVYFLRIIPLPKMEKSNSKQMENSVLFIFILMWFKGIVISRIKADVKQYNSYLRAFAKHVKAAQYSSTHNPVQYPE